MSLSKPRISRLLTNRTLLHTPTIRRRAFHRSSRLDVVKPFLLADIGEGITECQLIQWFVQPGARVEHFDKLCEVQSDKASVEITSPFDGVIKKLYYEPDDMAVTGKPLVDIDMDGEEAEEDVEKLGESEGKSVEHGMKTAGVGEKETQTETEPKGRRGNGKGDFGSLSTPAVRHLTKELDVNISDVTGTGRDGRVTKEDVHRFVSQKTQQTTEVAQPSSTSASTSTSTLNTTQHQRQQDQTLPLTPVQTQMFKLMTKSLSIPHFLYTTSADMSAVTTTRKRLNATSAAAQKTTAEKLTHLPFIIKATSLALQKHPLLNSALDTTSDPKKPSLTYRSAHNFGVAVDTPSGLLVPVLRNVQDLSIAQIALQLRLLSEKARTGKLAPGDFSGATFTISNIGSVGGGVVAPIISSPQVAILGVGRSRVVPAFGEDGEVVRREELVLSWSADHRVVDGAECARCAEHVTRLLEEPMGMLVEMR
jgi:2-oxoisovalerate dehydrogenase E2 component (dihydrolipoyl transacylase)